MGSTPTNAVALGDLLTGLNAVLSRLTDRLDSLEAHLGVTSWSSTSVAPESGSLTVAAQYVAATSSTSSNRNPPFHSRASTPKPPKGKEPATRTTKPKESTIPLQPISLHLAQTFPQEGKANRHLVTVVIPDAVAAHVIGRGGKGLKQVNDISGARIAAYSVTSGPRDERHVSICGTDTQVGDALVVLGKRMARKHVHPPKSKKDSEKGGKKVEKPEPVFLSSSTPKPVVSNPGPSRTPIPPPSLAAAPLRTPAAPSVSHQPSGSTTAVRFTVPPPKDFMSPSQTPPSVFMAIASPSPNPTPSVPTVTMASPSPTPLDPLLTAMEIDAIFEGRTDPPCIPAIRAQIAEGLVQSGKVRQPGY